MNWLLVVSDTVDVIAFFVVENWSAVLGFIMAVLGILFAFQLPRKYVLSKLSFGSKQSLPIGFDDPEWLAGKEGLRARLCADIQAYVAAPKELGIFKLLSYLEDHTRPLVITGDGGLGKTRLALELYRASGFRGVLVQKHASLEDVKSIIEDARLNRCRTLLIIDYIEQMGALYDGVHQAIISQSEGYAVLVTTTRTLSNGSAAMQGPEYLNSRTCQEVSLNEQLLLPWRKHVCEEILSNAKVPEPLRSQAINSAVPLIATLVSYDFSNHGMTDSKSDNDDGYWLVKRLRRHIDSNLTEEDFTFLLCLYPMDKAVREGLSKPLRKASDMLQRQGWVSTTGSGKAMQWHLGHDLLCDIPLVYFLVTEPDIALRLEAIERLGEYAKPLNASGNLATAISRALKKIIMDTQAQHIVPTLAACAQQIAFTYKERDTALEMVDKCIYSLSLGLGEKLRIITELRSLSRFQVDELLSTFNEELQAFIKLTDEHPADMYSLVGRMSMGNEQAYNRLCSFYALTQHQQPCAPLGLRGKHFPELYSINNDCTKLLDEFPADDSLSDNLRVRVAENLFQYANRIKRDELLQFVVVRYIDSSNIELKLVAVKAMFVKAQIMAERDRCPEAYNEVIDRFCADACDEIRLRAAMAAFNQANGFSKRDSDPDAYNKVIEMFGNDVCDKVRHQAAMAAFNQANGFAKRDSDPLAYNKVIETFGNDVCDEVRHQTAMAALGQANAIAKRDRDPRAYNKVIEMFCDDVCPKIQANMRDARAVRIGWSVVAQQYSQAIKFADEYLVDYASDCVDGSVVAFLAWLANRTQDNQLRYEKIVQGLGKQPTHWTFDEFAELIDSLPEEDKQYALQAIERLERTYENEAELESA
ncbi:hypothetical protein PA25_37240 [Pseudoalteromonas sp. A25]|uniref:hypothetical protein n=1 Tax=Pseudoalteromonas sp. A25 TaxID=116092 RepID=UPI001260F10E|nr:hypothetical protein [Pseudoalteromonas sp. A25]BBN83739.1 hypothetical protein PA25_37240 [Pseudoalteromonas sp. A25]